MEKELLDARKQIARRDALLMQLKVQLDSFVEEHLKEVPNEANRQKGRKGSEN